MNGVGKSSILESISYALFGKPLRGINKPQLVNSIINKNMLVELEFSVGPREYKVVRGQKPTIFEIYQDGRLINQDSASRDYQEMLESQVLKRSFKSFSQIEILSLANYTPFMKLPAGGRREIIEDLLDIQIFSSMNLLLKDKISANKTEIQDADNQEVLISGKIQIIRDYIEDLNRNRQELIDTREEQIYQYEIENVKLRYQIDQTEPVLKDLQNKLEESRRIQAAIEEKKSLYRAVQGKTTKINKDVSFYSENTTCPTCKQEIADSFRETELQKKTDLQEQASMAMQKLDETISALSKNLESYASIAEQSQKLAREVTEASIQIRTNEQFIESIKADILEIQNKMSSTTGVNESELASLIEELNMVKGKKEEAILMREVLGHASTLLKDAGIKTKIIRQYVPVMNKLVNKYLAAMDFFVEFNLDETFKETIRSRFRDEFTYDSFSQGEKLRIDLALLFTWRAIAKLRNSGSSNLLVFDEILDSSLDADGVDELLKILDTLAGDTNIMVISHRGNDIIDKFDHVIRFEKVRNFSRIAA